MKALSSSADPVQKRDVIPDKRRSRADPGSMPEPFSHGSRVTAFRSARDDGVVVVRKVVTP
jgi:hypothetical protein